MGAKAAQVRRAVTVARCVTFLDRDVESISATLCSGRRRSAGSGRDRSESAIAHRNSSQNATEV
jgi:hypothetical protein